MKKSSFVAMVLGVASGILFALGMCMALLPEWNLMKQGIFIGSLGLVLGLITVIVWRKMEHKTPIKLNIRSVLIFVFAVLGAIVLGIGMCFCMVWNMICAGILIGIFGICMLLCLIPLIKGFKD